MSETTGHIVPALPLHRDHTFDPPPQLGALREREPLSRLRFPDGHVGWLATGYDVVRRMLADARFSAKDLRHHPIYNGPAVQMPWAEGWFLEMDQPEHTRYRRPMNPEFTMRGLARLIPRIEQVVADQLSVMRAHGSPADLIATFAEPVPSIVICDLLGVPYQERDEFHADVAATIDMAADMDERFGAAVRIRDRMAEQVRRKHTEPADDLIGLLLREGSLNDRELANIALLMVVAGHITTVSMLGLGMFALLQDQRQLDRLRADPPLVDGTVEELLRYLTVFQHGVLRTATQDAEIDGRQIRAGDTISLSLPAANRDPARFPDPDRLDIGRQAKGHLAFGHGIHKCLGQELARIELRITLRGLLDAFPGLRLAVAPQDVPTGPALSLFHCVQALPVAW